MKWLAYCAPGRKVAAGLSLMLQGEQVTEVTENPLLAGSTDVILVNPAMLEPPEWTADAFHITPHIDPHITHWITP